MSLPGRLSGLRGRFLLLVGGIYLVVGALAAVSFLSVTRGIIRGLAVDYAAQYSLREKANILATVDREVVLAQKLADSPVLRQWSLDESDPTLKELALEELESFRRLFADRSVFFVPDASRHYYFGDATAASRGIQPRYTIQPGDPTTAWYFDAIQHVSGYALHVDNSAQLGVTKVWINAVIMDGDRKVGLGGTGLDLTGFVRELVRSSQPGVETILVDGNGFVQGHSDVALMEANARIRDESKRLKVFDLLKGKSDQAILKERLARLAAGATEVETFGLGTAARPVLAAVTYMKGIDWAALILVDPSRVIRMRQFAPILVLLVAALLATIVLVSWALDRFVLVRLARLTASTEDVAAGRYDIDLPTGRHDEIGRLAESFNRMAATIRSYTGELEHKVEQRTQELTKSNAALDASNRKLTDSIRYARLIQGALVASPADLAALLPEAVVLWRPRDVVGGDFYAIYPDGDGGFLLAVADCTGHGVPGAFMTMAAKALLDRVVEARGLRDPAAVLVDLNRNLRSLLSREGQGARNGLDLALLWARPGSTLRFASARLPLWIQAPDGTFRVVPGDRQSLGYAGTVPDFSFSSRDIPLTGGERIFLLTDGLLDQPHGQRGFGLGQRRLQEALTSWKDEPLAAIEGRLDALIAEHLGPVSQRDDITLVGFRLDAANEKKGEA